MLGLLVAVGAVAVLVLGVVVFGKEPPALLTVAGSDAPVDRWAGLLSHAGHKETQPRAIPMDVAGWYVGSPIEPLQFSRDLASLQTALGSAPKRDAATHPIAA